MIEGLFKVIDELHRFSFDYYFLFFIGWTYYYYFKSIAFCLLGSENESFLLIVLDVT